MRQLKMKLRQVGDHVNVAVTKIGDSPINSGNIVGYYDDGHLEVHGGLNDEIPQVKRIVLPSRNIIIETESEEVLYSGTESVIVSGSTGSQW